MRVETPHRQVNRRVVSVYSLSAAMAAMAVSSQSGWAAVSCTLSNATRVPPVA
ncbi:hypothetical protein H9L10_14830 [Phycicoccus endophyticus]|uniref:Uncharacterized protein n=1 Tax=Phycicoccus endophyticus TaxID=1690220 RepID=A0A7G9R1G3_9MICO|nr:hypothetical protein [Phycicoccus endophyticus]NHI18775.1 hypothetical protein [Phycicoccus endophyticus]QNN49438.1 hypothetical protein H9L10_14830 [Phycicoccus endophyticus]